VERPARRHAVRRDAGKSKKSKDGGSAAWFGGSIYALKGGNTQELWRYDPGPDSWHELDTLPLVGSAGRKRKVKAGGGIVAADDALYALKGTRPTSSGAMCRHRR